MTYCKAKVNEEALVRLEGASIVNYVLWMDRDGYAAMLRAMILAFEKEGRFAEAARLRETRNRFIAAHVRQ